jgi:hypothetical protein
LISLIFFCCFLVFKLIASPLCFSFFLIISLFFLPQVYIGLLSSFPWWKVRLVIFILQCFLVYVFAVDIPLHTTSDISNTFW